MYFIDYKYDEIIDTSSGFVLMGKMNQGMKLLVLNSDLAPISKHKFQDYYPFSCCTSNAFIFSGGKSSEILKIDRSFKNFERIKSKYIVVRAYNDSIFFAKDTETNNMALIDFNFKLIKTLQFQRQKNVTFRMHPDIPILIKIIEYQKENIVSYSCFDLLTNKALWEFNLEREHKKLMFINKHIVIVQSRPGSGIIVFLDLEGNLIWSIDEVGFNFSYNKHFKVLVCQASNDFKIIDLATGCKLREKKDFSNSVRYQIEMTKGDGIYYSVRKGDYTERFGKVNIESLEVEWEYPFERAISNGVKDWFVASNEKHIINHSYRKGPKIISFDPYSEANITFRTN